MKHFRAAVSCRRDLTWHRLSASSLILLLAGVGTGLSQEADGRSVGNHARDGWDAGCVVHSTPQCRIKSTREP